jgi:ERCC4 domain
MSKGAVKRKLPEVINVDDDDYTVEAIAVDILHQSVKEREIIIICDDDEEESLARMDSNPAACKKQAASWEVVLLVDDREPIDFLQRLSQAGIQCERRRLSVFDFLWVARARNQAEEMVIGHGVERKKINDLANALNTVTKGTGLSRSVSQKIKMCNSGVENKHYIVQGNIRDLDEIYFGSDKSIKKRVHENLREMKRDGYTVIEFALGAVPEIVAYLVGIHRHVEVAWRKQPPSNYMTLAVMTERTDWVTHLCSARKSLPSMQALGEKKLRLILQEFPISFETDYLLDNEAMVVRLASLKTDKRRGLSEDTARSLCSCLFGVATTTAKVTPDASIESSSSPHIASTRRRRLFNGVLSTTGN